MSVTKPLPHDSAARHVTGAARYVDDIPTPANALHLAFGLSTIARGRITSMDLDAVRAAHGVVDVLTAGDLPNGCDVHPSNHDEPLLSDGTVHYAGQPLFLVVATSHGAARRAAAKAQVSYDEETPILTVEQALAADSRFEDGPRIWTKGDVGAALDSAPHRITGRIEMGGQEHFYLEGQAALAVPNEGDMLVHSSTQHPTEIQHKVAEALEVPMHAVRVETRVVVHPEIVALAGDRHVVIAVVAHARWSPGACCDHSAGDGQGIPLAFLAAKAAAHAPDLDPHGVHRELQRLGDLVLDLGRVLGRRVNQHVAFVRYRQRGLAF